MKGNRMMRMMSLMVLISLAATHLSGQFNLLQPSFLWLAGLVSLVAFQASFTGFCPSSKLFSGTTGTRCCAVNKQDLP